MDEAEQAVTVYDAQGRRRLSMAAWRDMFVELYSVRELVWRLVHRDFIGQFKQSYVGVVWAVLPPVATTIVFSFLRSSQILNVDTTGTGLPYALWVLVGATVWQLFSRATTGVAGSVARSGALVSKVYFPREALAFAALGNALIGFAIQSMVVAVTFGFYLKLGSDVSFPPWQVVFVPLAILPLVLLALGLGLLLAPFNTMVRDVTRAVEFLFGFALFFAPTVYPTPVSPENLPKRILAISHNVNPVSHFMTAVRDLITAGRLSDPGLYWVCAAVSLVVFLVGWRFFHICEPVLAERT